MRDFALYDWAYSALICPVCCSSLARFGGTVRCAAGHAFDLSAKGTLNLSSAAGANHGDDAGMIAARRRFLATGYYAPLSAALSDAIAERLSGDRPLILDAGCGEGTYTAAVADRLPCAHRRTQDEPSP